MNVSSAVTLAEFELKQAQARLDAALQVQSAIDSFGEPVERWAVMAKTPTFDQFVSYSNEGILVAVFDDSDTADRYASTVKAPAGFDHVVEPVKVYS